MRACENRATPIFYLRGVARIVCAFEVREMELLFVSARSSRKDKTSPALLYRLDDERDLPEPSQSHPWAGKNVSALRDR